MLKTLLRPAMIIIPFIVGFLFPKIHVLNNPPVNIVRWFVMTMVFIACLQLNLKDLKVRREHGYVLLINLLMGIVPFFIVRYLCPEQPDFAKALFFTGITPTATSAPVVVTFLNGRLGFALTGMALSITCISVSLLILLPVVTGQFSMDFVLQVVYTLLMLTAVPFSLAMLLRRIWPGIKELPKKIKLFTFSLWSVILTVMSASARQYFLDHPEEPLRTVFLIAFCSLIICILNFYFGRIVSRKKYRRESSQILGQKNTGYTMYLALQFATPLAALGPISYILWHNLWNAWQMFRYDIRLQRRKNHEKKQ